MGIAIAVIVLFVLCLVGAILWVAGKISSSDDLGSTGEE